MEFKQKFGVAEWREEMKSLTRKAGVERKPMVFLLKDSQIVNDAFLEDVNNLLNNGEVMTSSSMQHLIDVQVPNLFPSEEVKQLIEDVKNNARESGREVDKDSVYNFFVDTCKKNIHIVFCASPDGDTLRSMLRKFPALVNCCTVDWYSEWPVESLRGVAQQRLKNLDLPPTSEDSIVDVCVFTHQQVSR